MELYGEKLSYYEHFPRCIDFRNFRIVLKEIAGKGIILDYGCGHGSLGYLGVSDDLATKVDGFDFKSNKLAKYNNLNEIQHDYDTVVFSHVLEHFGTDGPSQRKELAEVMIKVRNITNRLVIALPNTQNIFMRLSYQDDWTHNPITLDNNLFLGFMECFGWELKKIVRCDAQLNIDPRNWFRFLSNLFSRKDFTYNIIYVFEKRKRNV